MFTTINEVNELTGRAVAQETLIMAQAVVESFVGRVEADVTNATDGMLLGRATAYQAVYMETYEDLFEQSAIVSTNQFGSSITFRQDGVTPWIAPLSVIACQKLSWRRMRSVKTGSMFDAHPEPTRWDRA